MSTIINSGCDEGAGRSKSADVLGRLDTDRGSEATATAVPEPRAVTQLATEVTSKAVAESSAPLSFAPPRNMSRGQEFDHLEPLLRRYAALPSTDPARGCLREQLVTAYLPLAQRIARRYAQRGEPLEDLTQVGYLALIKAIDRYQPGVGHHFLGFAVPTITGEIRRHFRDKTWVIRVPRPIQELRQSIAKVIDQLSTELRRAPRPSEIAHRLGVTTEDVLETLQAAQSYRPDSLDEVLRPTGDSEPRGDLLGHVDNGFEVATDAHAVAPHLAALPERERHILYLRFYEDLSQTEIARRVGLSQMHVSRLLSQTLTQLRDAVDGPGAEGAEVSPTAPA
jgi:RNA polymerase sigma-B factor